MSVALAPFGSHRRHSLSTSPFLTEFSSFNATDDITTHLPPSPSLRSSFSDNPSTPNLDLDFNLSFGAVPYEDKFVDSRPSTPYEHSFAKADHLLSMTEASHQHPRFLVPQTYPAGLSKSLSSYPPPPMPAGSSQPQQQQWNTHSDWSHLNSQLQPDYRQEAFRSHQRHLSSGSSIASGGPDSPYTQSAAFPLIVDTESQSFNSPQIELFEAPYSGGSQFTKPYTACAIPSNDGTLFSSHLDLPLATNNVKSYSYYPSSTAGQNTMSRQRTSVGGARPSLPDASSYGSEFNAAMAARGNPTLDRTMSDVYQDELYNPNMGLPQPASQTSQQQQNQGNLLSPSYQNTTFNDRIQAANAARSASPASTIARERSPFREESAYAGTQDVPQLSQPPAVVRSAARLREEQKRLSDAAAYAQHHPQISRHDFAEPSTISPKDALLDYHPDNESNHGSLFPQVACENAAGLKRKMGGRQGKAAQSQHQSSLTSSNTPTYPASSQSASSNLAFMAPSMPNVPQQYPFISHSRRQSSSLQSHMSDQMPAFPATLSSMESTKSDGGGSDSVRPPGFVSQSQQSSQEESASSPVQRPSDVSARSGTYTCTAPSCTARFDNSSKLYKHRRETHATRTSTSASASASPYTASSNADASPSESTPSSATATAHPSQDHANAAHNASRNNLPGPHKCDKINPSTGKPCGTIFSRSYDLTRHEDTIHNNRKLKVRCHYCTEEKTFSRNDALTRHMRVVHPEVEQGAGKNRRSTRVG